MQNYMTYDQFQRHRKAIEDCETKLDAARKKVGAAAEHGDLSENAEYEAAIEESGFLAGRLEELKAVAVGVAIIEPKNTVEGMVTIGKTVEVKEHGETTVYHIVGNGTLDTDAGEVSYIAPLGAALIGKREGELATVTLPSGDRELEVVSVRFSD